MAKNYHYVRWNHADDRLLLELRSKGHSFYKIAHEFGMTKESVVSRWHKIKLKQDKKELLRTWSYTI